MAPPGDPPRPPGPPRSLHNDHGRWLASPQAPRGVGRRLGRSRLPGPCCYCGLPALSDPDLQPTRGAKIMKNHENHDFFSNFILGCSRASGATPGGRGSSPASLRGSYRPRPSPWACHMMLEQLHDEQKRFENHQKT